MVEGIQYGGGIPSVRWRVLSTVCHPISKEEHIVSTVEGVQYSGWFAVRTCHTIKKDLSHHQYIGGYAVRISHIISMDEGVQHRTTETAQGVGGRKTILL